VPAGMMASVTFVPAATSMQRCTMPSPPHTKIRSALPRSAFSTCFGAKRLFGTSRQKMSPTPRSASVRRSSESPPPSVFPLCAMTAMRAAGRREVTCGQIFR